MSRTARDHLGLMMAAQGRGGVLLVESAKFQPLECQAGELGESADGADLPPGTMKYPDCICAEHRADRGKPDSSVRLSAVGDIQIPGQVVTARRRFVVTRSGLASVAEKSTGGPAC